MSDRVGSKTPVWTLATSNDPILEAAPLGGDALTPERLAELRSALASFSSAPLVTLETHPLPKRKSSGTHVTTSPADVVIEIEKHGDGSLHVLPVRSA